MRKLTLLIVIILTIFAINACKKKIPSEPEIVSDTPVNTSTISATVTETVTLINTSTASPTITITATKTVTKTITMTATVTETSTPVHPYVSHFGVTGTGDGQFTTPSGISIYGSSIYVCDMNGLDYARVSKFTTAGVFEAGYFSYGTGSEQFYEPARTLIDSFGNMYVCGGNLSEVKKFDSNGNYLLNVAYGGGGAAGIIGAKDMAFDHLEAAMWVVDFYHDRVLKFSLDGTHLDTIGSSGSGDGEFNRPYGILIDSTGDIFVSEYSNHRIQRFSSTGVFEAKWGSYGSGNGQFDSPSRMVLDLNENLLVVDVQNKRVQIFDKDGNFINKFGSFGIGNGQFGYPSGIAVDSVGHIYVSDHASDRVTMFHE